MNDQYGCSLHHGARELLRSMTTAQIQGGLRAFAHPPRNQYRPDERHGDTEGCFVCAAFGISDEATKKLWRGDFDTLSWCYENYHHTYHNDNEWLRTECIRELAERGIIVESTLFEEVST